MTEHSRDCNTPADAGGSDANCSEVIAEVWTLLDGECTAETKAKIAAAPEECPVPAALRGRGTDQDADRPQVQW